MHKVIPEAYARQDLVYFNCLHSQIYSYMKHRDEPIDLQLYRCLEEPNTIYQQFIIEGKTRWTYPFDIFTDNDFENIGHRAHNTTGKFEELKKDITASLELGEVVFLSIDPGYLPHRDEFKHHIRNRRHWLVIIGYDRLTNKYLVMDEEYTYYAIFEYDEQMLATAFSNGPERMIRYTSVQRNIEKMKEDYVRFYQKFDSEQALLFEAGLIKEKLRQDPGTMADRLFAAYSFLSGSLQITRQFFRLLNCPDEVIGRLEALSKLCDNISAVIKKFELTGRMNDNYLEDKLPMLNRYFGELADYVKSKPFHEHLASVSLLELIRQSGPQEGTTLAQKDNSISVMELKQYSLNLGPYYNNQAFGEANAVADLTGGGEYFLLDGQGGLQDTVAHQHIRFGISASPGQGCDNISCQGQIIEVENREYNGMWILGCGEWGDPQGVMGIQYEGGDIDGIPVQITDWAWPPRYGESIALTFPIARKEKMAFVPESGYLFALHLPMTGGRPVHKLLLPDCPNMHIFSIVLTYNS